MVGESETLPVVVEGFSKTPFNAPVSDDLIEIL